MAEGYYAIIPKTTAYSKELNALPSSARWLFVILAIERHGLAAQFKMPYEKIREVTGYSRTTISRGVKALAQAGIISYTHGGLEKNPNRYAIEDSLVSHE